MSTVNRDRPDALSMAEVLRIMDVATAIRQDREVVEEQLNLDELKARLRDRMIATAKVTGEEVTPAEVDAAITQYYQSLYTFHEPEPSFNLILAHAWVRRNQIIKSGGAAVLALILTWTLVLSPSGPLTITGRTRKQLDALTTDVNKRRKAILSLTNQQSPPDELYRLSEEAKRLGDAGEVEKLRKVDAALAELEAKLERIQSLDKEVDALVDEVRAAAKEQGVGLEVDRLAKEAETYKNRNDPERLEEVRNQLSELDLRVRAEYTVSVISRPGERSAIKRAYSDKEGKRLSGYYVIVEAKNPDGHVVKRRVHNSETSEEVDATIWAERVPEEVYNRLGKDKKEDGILDETKFAVKRRGYLNEETTMPGSDGRPLARGSADNEVVTYGRLRGLAKTEAGAQRVEGRACAMPGNGWRARAEHPKGAFPTRSSDCSTGADLSPRGVAYRH